MLHLACQVTALAASKQTQWSEDFLKNQLRSDREASRLQNTGCSNIRLRKQKNDFKKKKALLWI